MEERFEVEEIGDGGIGVPEDAEGACDDEVDVAGNHGEIFDEAEVDDALLAHGKAG